MKTIKLLAMMAALTGLLAFSLIEANWRVKSDEAEVKFTSKKINGTFSGLKANILFDERHPEEAKIAATIDATSIATGFFLKNMHAKDALGADNYPTIKFESTAVAKNGNGYAAKGNLTLKGITRPAVIYFTFKNEGNQGIFNGEMKIIPRDFGIDHNGTPNQVTVQLTVPVTKI